jgi:hypothetical protein
MKSLFRRTDPAQGAEATGERPEVRPVCALTYKFNDIGELLWNSDHNSDRLTVTGDGLTISWDENKNKEDEMTPCWIPASTRLFLHSGQFSLDFRIDEMAERQIGVGFMLQLTDGVNVGSDWGFFGYLGSSNTAWAYDPSTGDVVTATESIEGGLPRIDNGHSGVVRMRVSVPRQESGFVRFMMNGIESKQISLPVGAVILPAACFLKTGQKVTLSNFQRTDSDGIAQQTASADG